MGQNIATARSVFDGFCQYLEENDSPFSEDRSCYTIRFVKKGEDLPISITIVVDPERFLMKLSSELFYKPVADGCNADASQSVFYANTKVSFGCFEFIRRENRIVFRMASSFSGSEIGKEFYEFFIRSALQTVDRYNELFYQIGIGRMDYKKFVEVISKRNG